MNPKIKRLASGEWELITPKLHIYITKCEGVFGVIGFNAKEKDMQKAYIRKLEGTFDTLKDAKKNALDCIGWKL